jgi:hypothetical protein
MKGEINMKAFIYVSLIWLVMGGIFGVIGTV